MANSKELTVYLQEVFKVFENKTTIVQFAVTSDVHLTQTTVNPFYLEVLTNNLYCFISSLIYNR